MEIISRNMWINMLSNTCSETWRVSSSTRSGSVMRVEGIMCVVDEEVGRKYKYCRYHRRLRYRTYYYSRNVAEVPTLLVAVIMLDSEHLLKL